MQDERKITRYIIGAAVLGYGLLVVLFAVFYPAHGFFYADTDCLSLLHAKGFFHQLTYDGVSPMPVPYASLNLVLSLILWLGLQSPLSPTILRVGGQITLFALFLLTLVRVLPEWFKEKNRALFFLLLAIHPLFWGISLFSIHVLLTIWLFFLVLLCYSNISSHPFMVWCAIWLLSCSGMEGFWLAVLFVAYIVVKDGVMADTRRQRKGILLLLSGLLPAFCFYAGLSLLSGQLGGPYVGSAFSPTAGYVFGTLLSGAWGETFRAFLVFVGNGFLSLPFIVPLFGILAFLGFFEVCQWKPRTFRGYGFFMFG
ncbi:hypothetical protein GF373_07360, partial [bacterium]|nr:hypothetical protein [bacterium]